MKSNERGAGLPGSVAKKLRAIQRRAVGFTFLRGVILAGAVLLAAMLRGHAHRLEHGMV